MKTNQLYIISLLFFSLLFPPESDTGLTNRTMAAQTRKSQLLFPVLVVIVVLLRREEMEFG